MTEPTEKVMAGRTPNTLTVVIMDTNRTRIAIVHENEHLPYGRRSVRIRLTDEQVALLHRRRVGTNRGADVFEEYGPCWLEESPDGE